MTKKQWEQYQETGVLPPKTRYWTVSLWSDDLVWRSGWGELDDGDHIDRRLAERGLIFRTQKDAQMAAKRMLEAVKK